MKTWTVWILHYSENPVYVLPSKGIARPQSQFPHSRVYERFIYSQDRSTYFPAAEYADQLWENINRSQTHEYGEYGN